MALTGPTFLENLRTGPVVSLDVHNVGGRDFVDRIDRLIVGPRSHITVYDEESFGGERVAFGPGAKVPDLAMHRFDNRIRSIEGQCD